MWLGGTPANYPMQLFEDKKIDSGLSGSFKYENPLSGSSYLAFPEGKDLGTTFGYDNSGHYRLWDRFERF